MIDSHQHFWKRDQFDYSWLEAEDLASINRDFLPEDLRPLREEVGITHSIVVQTQHNLDENCWALKLAEADDSIAGVVRLDGHWRTGDRSRYRRVLGTSEIRRCSTYYPRRTERQLHPWLRLSVGA